MMSWIDYAVLGVLAVSVVLGLVRGFVREVLSLLGWLLALYLAAVFATDAAMWLPQDFATLMIRQLIAALAIFLVVSVVTGILAWLIAKLVHSVGLGLIDRLLGAMFGFARGLLLVLIIAIGIALSPIERQPAWRDAYFGAPLRTAVIALKPHLPHAIAARLKFE
jgi:membrane protein required for colicin V production